MSILRKAVYVASNLVLLASAQNSSLSGTAKSPNVQCDYIVGAPVNTTSGVVWGHRAHNATDVSEYLGIPFAQPPVGPLRFAPPVRYTSNKVLNAHAYVSLDANQRVAIAFRDRLTKSRDPGALRVSQTSQRSSLRTYMAFSPLLLASDNPRRRIVSRSMYGQNRSRAQGVSL